MRERFLRAAARTALGTDWLVKLASRGRNGDGDAALDRQIAAMIEVNRIARLPRLEDMDIEAGRKYAAEGLSPFDPDPVAMAQVIDTQVEAIPVRIYVPHDAGRDWLVYFHGGGGAIGSIASSDAATRYVAAKTRCTVASVQYRLGPEHPHPAAIDDSFAAYAGLLARVPERSKVAVGGDSFGGFLSVWVDHLARERGVRRPDAQLLVYPVVDLTLTSPSIDRLGDGYLLTKKLVHWFRDHYLGHQDQKSASPWFWTDLHGSAPAIVVTAGYDPLVDEGDAWARRLEAAGVKLVHRRYDSLIHGFISMTGAVTAARTAVDEFCADLIEMLRS
jgi:acetyl esterase